MLWSVALVKALFIQSLPLGAAAIPISVSLLKRWCGTVELYFHQRDT